jgi:uncharacterized membrane protein
VPKTQPTDTEHPGPARRREPPEAELEDLDRLLAAAAYVPVVCLTALIVRRREEFVAFHARQGLALFVLEILAAMLFFLPAVGPTLGGAVGIACLAAAARAGRTASRGACWEIPGVAKLAAHINL